MFTTFNKQLYLLQIKKNKKRENRISHCFGSALVLNPTSSELWVTSWMNYWHSSISRMEELHIDRDRGSVCFGQLLGMCDHVSLTLGKTDLQSVVYHQICDLTSVWSFLSPHPSAKEGYAVYKSVPYGSVDDTIPYLVRRAQENRTVLQGIRKERDLLRREFKHRMGLIVRGGSSWKTEREDL